MQTREKMGKGTVKVEDASKRDALIEAAKVLFTTRGYETTTMAEVAKQAGVGVGTVYLYFKNKSDLLYAVKGDWEHEFLSFMQQPEIQAIPHHLRARPFVEAAFAQCELHTDMIQFMGMQPELIGDWNAQDHGLIVEALEGLFEEAIAAGAFRQVDPHAAAVVSFGMVNQALLQCYVQENGQNKQLYIDTLVDAFEEWLLADD